MLRIRFYGILKNDRVRFALCDFQGAGNVRHGVKLQR